ncbi:MAG TPA: ABC transporter substrate-binding protein, partial [Stellaceae bacterium]|nr:ABC transporter substrate-binding protein [Stellaceae bacterium]
MFARIIGVAAIALACSAGLSQADEKVRVGTPEPTAFSFSVVDVGNAAGIFKKYGIEAERIDFAGGAKMHQAMDAGALDVITGTGSDLLFLTKGAPEKGVAAYANDLAAVSLVVNADDPVKKIEDLKGKTIAVSTTGSFTSWVAKTILGQHGIAPDQF